MIDWVHVLCQEWGDYARKTRVDGGQKPMMSPLGKMIEQGPGAGHQEFGPVILIAEPPKAYTLISIALQHMKNTHRLVDVCDVLEAHYAQDGKAHQKAKQMNMSVQTYWARVTQGQFFIAGFVPKVN